MPLSTEERTERARQRMIEKAKEYQTSTYCRRFVVPIFQKLIRAEFAAVPSGCFPAVVDGEIAHVERNLGQCVCVTCGKVHWWDSGIKGIHTGHFLASKRNSIQFEEDNVAPQCSSCNVFLSGAPQAFRKWMMYARGGAVVERLERLKTKSVTFDREELVDMKISYATRLKAAEERMKQG